MTKKKGNRKRKPQSENPTQPPPPPQSTTPLTSPIKVLVSSSKLNVPPSPKKQPELHSEVNKCVNSFNENMRNNVDANGTLNLDGFLKGPSSTSDESNPVIVILPVKGSAEGEGRSDVVIQPVQFNEQRSVTTVPSVNSQEKLQHLINHLTQPPTPQVNQIESTTDTTNGTHEPKQHQSPESLQVHESIPIKTYNRKRRSPRKKPSDPPPKPTDTTSQITMTEPLRSAAAPNMDITPRVLNTLEQARQTIAESMYQNDHARLRYALEPRCAENNCKKRASVQCPGCELLVYCTDRHRRSAKMIHHQFCNGYRVIDTKLGKQAIANRDTKRSEVVLTDEPALVLPLNPSMTNREFPSNYCVKCFKDSTSNPKKSNKFCRCSLPVCGQGCTVLFCETRRDYDRIPPHTEHECKLLSTPSKRPHHVFILDQSFVSLLRAMRLEGRISEEITTFLELVNSVEYSKHRTKFTKNFENKLMVIRNLLHVDASTVPDDTLYKMDQALVKFGRNVTSDSVQWMGLTEAWRHSTFIRCIFPKLAYVMHSCIPNNLMYIHNNLNLEIKAVADIKPGEILTINYDERSTWLPTHTRRQYLQTQFSTTCKCKRCLSPTELSTYFSSYPCFTCPAASPNYLIPDNPQDQYSDWHCQTCKITPVFYLRVIDADIRFGQEIEACVAKRNSFDLLDLMNELVLFKYLHWNHHLLFNASIKMFEFLWEELNRHDKTVMAKFSQERGLMFLSPAEAVIHITGAFMPHSYSINHAIPLRLASLIKLRHLTDQLVSRKTTIQKLNSFVQSTYFRSNDIHHIPLYNRHPPEELTPTQSNRNMKILELKLLDNLCNTVFRTVDAKQWKLKGRDILLMFDETKKDKDAHRTFLRNRGPMGKDLKGSGIFPWDFDV